MPETADLIFPLLTFCLLTFLVASDYCSDPGSLYYWGDVRRGGQRLEHFLKKMCLFFVKKNVKKFF